tara:strand:+ start:49 stop:732 length:684 start_codon:yes stop_codon:yes gene_type:complete
MKKGIYGFGDSFMWGEGLYFYSEYENLPFKPKHEYDSHDMRMSFLQFKNKHRYITKVADYLDTWSLTQEDNGGTNGNTLAHFEDLIKQDKLRYTDIGLIIYQFTGPERDDISVEKQFDILLQHIEIWKKYNIPYYFLCWLDLYQHHPLYEKYFMDKHIWIINNDGKELFSWDELVNTPNSNLSVESDFAKDGYQIGDTHLNIKGHDVVANSIIDRLIKDKHTIKKIL